MPEPPLTRDAVLDLVRKAEIVDDDVLASFMTRGPGLPPTASDTASRMIQAGILTPFQAKLILQGRYRGFRLGPYKILDQIGAGGMGQVFLAEHMTMRRKVALKVLPAKQAADRVGVERFYREARAVAALDHPNIVRAHDVGFDRGSHYLVLEYVEGIDLGSRIKEAGGRIPVGEATGYAVQAAAGLQHAHEKGLVHRDVKPQNLLVDKDGVLKILDMGLARFFEDEDDKLTAKLDGGGVMGTADYVSPEQLLDSASIDHRADIYSLGATFYHLITGQTPFSGNTTSKLVAHQLHEAPAPNEVCADNPEEVSDAIEKMMQKDPDDRYQATAEIIPDLLPFVGDPRRGPGASGTLPALAVAGLGNSTMNLAAAMHQAALNPPLSKAQRKKMIALASLGGLIVVAGLIVAVVIATQPESRQPARLTPPGSGDQIIVKDPPPIPIEKVVPTLGFRLAATAKTAVEVSAFTPDGKKLLTGGGDKLVRVWDANTGQHVRDLKGHTGTVRGLSLLPGGARVLSSGSDKTVRLWNVETGELLRTYEGHEKYVTNVVSLPNGRQFLTACEDGNIWLWDVDTAEIVKKYPRHPLPVYGLAVTRDGLRGVAASWDGKRNEPKAGTDLSNLPPLVVWSFDLSNGKELKKKAIQASASHVALSPNSQTAAVGTSTGVGLWDFDTDVAVRTATGSGGRVLGVGFTRDGKYVLGTGRETDANAGTLYVWQSSTGHLLGSERVNAGHGYHLSVAPDGKRVSVTGANGVASVWVLPPPVSAVTTDSTTLPTLTRILTGHLRDLEDVEFTPDGKKVVGSASNRDIRVWDAATGEQTLTFKMPGKLHRSMRLLSGNRMVAVDSQEPIVRTYDLETGRELRQFPHDEGVISVGVMPGGKQFVTCGHLQPMRLWDADSGEEVARFASLVDARGLAVTPDGKHILVGGNDKSVRVWSIAEKKEIRAMPLTTVPWRIGVSPDGQWAGVGNDKNLVLWNLKTFETRQLTGSAAFIDGVAFTPDGRHVLAATQDRCLQAWDTATGQSIGRVTEHRGAARHVSVSADGQFAATTSTDGTAMVWKLPESMRPKK
ncbi:MAG TPA: serine/threonine-protein kinase [Gemmataceae bacterium]|nr:serine/threonine-protein kinase [Gemmataceae bacterium]